MISCLTKCAEHSRILLIAGLVAGIGLPGLAAAMAPWLPEMVAILLVITAFRIGLRRAVGTLADLRWSMPVVLILQVGVPLVLAGLFWLSGYLGTPLALALILAAAAPTLSGGASLAIILGLDPGRVMQIFVLGTAAFPLTSLVVLQVMPVPDLSGALIEVGLRSLLTIAGATAVGFGLRRVFLPYPDAQQLRAVDGAAVLFFAIIVVGLMSAFGPTLAEEPVLIGWWLLAAFALCFGLQIMTLLMLSSGRMEHVAGPIALCAGNRNIALFLVALPAEVTAPIMPFIACWQLPMYLTPILLGKLYRPGVRDE